MSRMQDYVNQFRVHAGLQPDDRVLAEDTEKSYSELTGMNSDRDFLQLVVVAARQKFGGALTKAELGSSRNYATLYFTATTPKGASVDGYVTLTDEAAVKVSLEATVTKDGKSRDVSRSEKFNAMDLRPSAVVEMLAKLIK